MKRSILTAALAFGLLAAVSTPVRAEGGFGFGVGLGLGFNFTGIKSGNCGQGPCGAPGYPQCYPPMFAMPYPCYGYNPMMNYGWQQPFCPPPAPPGHALLGNTPEPKPAAKPVQAPAPEKKEGKLVDGTKND